MSNTINSEFWGNVLRAAETEPREVTALKGASGYAHPVVALGVDEDRNRVVMISGESDARTAALAQWDVQAAMPSVKVAMARPIAINLSWLADVITQAMGSVTIGEEQLTWMGAHEDKFKEKMTAVTSQATEKLTGFVVSPWRDIGLDITATLLDGFRQLTVIDVDSDKKSDSSTPTFDLSRLKAMDPAMADRRSGICSIPLYDLSEDIVERLCSRRDVDLAKEILKQQGVLQYFFPPADQLALGLVDRGEESATTLVEHLKLAPNEGHPFGICEIVDSSIALNNIVPALQDMGLLVEGDASFDISDDGRQYRLNVQFRPQEGLLSKLARFIPENVHISLQDIFMK